MTVKDDVRTAALWIACVLGDKYLYAIYYKPKVRNVAVSYEHETYSLS